MHICSLFYLIKIPLTSGKSFFRLVHDERGSHGAESLWVSHSDSHHGAVGSLSVSEISLGTNKLEPDGLVAAWVTPGLLIRHETRPIDFKITLRFSRVHKKNAWERQSHGYQVAKGTNWAALSSGDMCGDNVNHDITCGGRIFKRKIGLRTTFPHLNLSSLLSDPIKRFIDLWSEHYTLGPYSSSCRYRC